MEKLFRRGGLAAHLLAGALGNVLPFRRVVVDLGALRRARVFRRPAIVLSGLGDAVALFGAFLLRHGLRGNRSGESDGDETGDGGLNRGLRIHVLAPGVSWARQRRKPVSSVGRRTN